MGMTTVSCHFDYTLDEALRWKKEVVVIKSLNRIYNCLLAAQLIQLSLVNFLEFILGFWQS
jgi:hypothetical protein